MWLVLFGIVVLSTGAPQEKGSRLKPGSGRELVATICTACHTDEIIVQSHMSRTTWNTTITWMQETQGLGPLEPDVRREILDYLEQTQGIDAEDEMGGESPWAYPLYRPNPVWNDP